MGIKTASDFELSESNIEDLNRLIQMGYQPCINLLDSGLWHVGLNHVSYASQMVKFDDNVFRAKPCKLSIHAQNSSLSEAFDEVFSQLNA